MTGFRRELSDSEIQSEDWIYITDAAEEIGTSYIDVYSRVQSRAVDSGLFGSRRLVQRSDLPRLREMILKAKTERSRTSDESAPSELMSVSETAAALDVPKHAIYNRIRDEKIKAVEKDGRKFIP